jgi:hypothetical protein
MDILKAKLDSITEIFTTALKTSYDTAAAYFLNGTNVLNHASTLNPHNVTKTQVGLSNLTPILQVRLLLILLI